MKQPHVSVVILNWNGIEFLKKFLFNIISHTKDAAEIVLVDNASTDDSVSYLRENFPSLRLIILDKNYGFAGGYNLALKQIKAEYYVLLNSDIETTENWLPPLIQFMEENTRAGVCQPKLKSYFEKDKFEYAGAAGGFIDKWGYPFCRGRIFNTLEFDKGQYDTIQSIFWATGACLLVRADLYHKLGGLDDDFFAHMEEIDFCWRVKNEGYQVICNPASTIYHWGGGTLPKSNPKKTFLNFRNNLFLLFKNLPKSRLLIVYPLRIFLDGVAAVKFLSEGNAGDMVAVFKAHFAFLFHIRNLYKKRKQLKHKNNTEIYNKSIVVKYYFQKRKHFSELEN